MSKLNKIIYLDSAEQFVELYQNGTVTKANGVVVTYNENDLYLIAKKPITVDSELNSTSENPVKNKVLFERFEDIDDELSQKFGRGDAAEFFGVTAWGGGVRSIEDGGDGQMIIIFPNSIEFSQYFDGRWVYPKILGHKSSPNASAQEEFYLPEIGGTLATEETTQRKRYRHTILLTDTTQELTLRFILVNSTIDMYATADEILSDVYSTTNLSFAVIGGTVEGAGMITSPKINGVNFDIIMFIGSDTITKRINIANLAVSEAVEEL